MIDREKYLERQRRYNRSPRGREREARYERTYHARRRKLRYEIEVRALKRGGYYGYSQKDALAELDTYLASDGPSRGLNLAQWLNEVDPLPSLRPL